MPFVHTQGLMIFCSTWFRIEIVQFLFGADLEVNIGDFAICLHITFHFFFFLSCLYDSLNLVILYDLKFFMGFVEKWLLIY